MIIMIMTLSRVLLLRIFQRRAGFHIRYTTATVMMQSMAPTPAASDGVATPP